MTMACVWLKLKLAGSLGHVKGSEVIRLEKQSNGRSAHTLRKAKQSQTEKRKKNSELFFLHPGSRNVETLADLRGKVSY